jgi:hypothetical protein
MQMRLLLTSRNYHAPRLIIRNSEGITLPYKIRFRFFRGLVLLAQEVRMQYAGYNLSNLRITKITIRDYLVFLNRDFSQAFRDLFFSFEITLDISKSNCYPISITVDDNDQPVWVSRSAINSGVLANKMSPEIEWDRLRYSKGISVFIWGADGHLFRRNFLEQRQILIDDTKWEILTDFEVDESCSPGEMVFHSLENCKVFNGL